MVPVILMRAKRDGELCFLPASNHAFGTLMKATGYGWFYPREWEWVSRALAQFADEKLTTKWCHIKRIPRENRIDNSRFYTV